MTPAPKTLGRACNPSGIAEDRPGQRPGFHRHTDQPRRGCTIVVAASLCATPLGLFDMGIVPPGRCPGLSPVTPLGLLAARRVLASLFQPPSRRETVGNPSGIAEDRPGQRPGFHRHTDQPRRGCTIVVAASLCATPLGLFDMGIVPPGRCPGLSPVTPLGLLAARRALRSLFQPLACRLSPPCSIFAQKAKIRCGSAWKKKASFLSPALALQYLCSIYA